MEDKDKVNFLLLGKTGQGKSATGNTLLGRRFFKTSGSFTSNTKKVSNSFATFDKYTLLVVDGPGLEDTDMTNHEEKTSAASNMSNALTMCHGSVNAFLFVQRYSVRITAEDKATLETLKGIFGPQYLDHMIIIITCGDLYETSEEVEEENITFDEWCKKQDGIFRDLYKKCNGRCVLFNNREKDEQKNRGQIQKLIDTALELTRDRGPYTSQCFKEAENVREIMITKARAPELQREYQEKISLLSATIETLKNEPSASEKDRIKAAIQDLKSTMEKEDRGSGVLNELLKYLESLEEILNNREENMNNLEKLQSLAKDMEKIRESEKNWDIYRGILCFTLMGVAAAVLPPEQTKLALEIAAVVMKHKLEQNKK